MYHAHGMRALHNRDREFPQGGRRAGRKPVYEIPLLCKKQKNEEEGGVHLLVRVRRVALCCPYNLL